MIFDGSHVESKQISKEQEAEGQGGIMEVSSAQVGAESTSEPTGSLRDGTVDSV